MTFMDMRDILGVQVAALTEPQALEFIHDQIENGRHLKLAFCNAHTANIAWRDAGFRHVLAQFTVFADGIGVDLGSMLSYGSKFPANLNGTDFVPRLLETAPRPLSVLLLGGQPEVAQRAAMALNSRFPLHRISVLHHGFFDARQEIAMLAELEATKPDVLLVAMGNPLQEKWIARHCTRQNCHVAVGVGALFDFLAGDAKRAPARVRGLRLEWLWRLTHEPIRLFWRYVVGNPLFMLRVGGMWLKDKLTTRWNEAR
jgi:exopolysaccharide biosynthesis WecB/TagA/CpsF family protein